MMQVWPLCAQELPLRIPVIFKQFVTWDTRMGPGTGLPDFKQLHFPLLDTLRVVVI